MTTKSSLVSKIDFTWARIAANLSRDGFVWTEHIGVWECTLGDFMVALAVADRQSVKWTVYLVDQILSDRRLGPFDTLDDAMDAAETRVTDGVLGKAPGFIDAMKTALQEILNGTPDESIIDPPRDICPNCGKAADFLTFLTVCDTHTEGHGLDSGPHEVITEGWLECSECRMVTDDEEVRSANVAVAK